VELGATQRREAQPGQGHGKGAVGNVGSVARASCRGGIRGVANHRQQARSVADRGSLGVAPWCGLPA
jgi:hypothetical protein